MSSETHTDARINKAELLRTLESLLSEARDPADSFEDVPFDFRHAEKKQREWLRFPEEWKMTDERRKILKEKREERMLEDGNKKEEGTLLDGGELVQKELERSMGKEPVMVEASRENLGAVGRKPTRLT